MKNKIEIKYISKKSEDFRDLVLDDRWQMTVHSDIVGKQIISLSTQQAMVVALAIGIAKETGKKEGYAKAKKKLKAINEAAKQSKSLGYPWSDAEETGSK